MSQLKTIKEYCRTEEEKFKRLIKKTGLKKGYIAKKIGCTQSELSHILSGIRKYPEYRRKLARFLSL